MGHPKIVFNFIFCRNTFLFSNDCNRSSIKSRYTSDNCFIISKITISVKLDEIIEKMGAFVIMMTVVKESVENADEWNTKVDRMIEKMKGLRL